MAVHFLLINLSNCVYNGNVFDNDVETLESLIQTELDTISNLEFRGVGCSMVRGDTDSLTLGAPAAYYNSTANLTESESLSLRSAVVTAMTNITGLTISEIRIETTLI